MPVNNYRYLLPADPFQYDPINATSPAVGASMGRNPSAGSKCISVEIIPLFFNKIVKSNTLFLSPFPECIWKPELRRNLKVFWEESWGEENYVEYVRRKPRNLLVWQWVVFICKMNFWDKMIMKMITQSHGTKEPAALIASCPLTGSKKSPSARALYMDVVWYKYHSI